jgi:2-phosphosulfolactate phosphatase
LKITVYFEFKDAKPTVMQNATVVMADVLRATTSIAVYLYHGASAVAMCPEPGTAKKVFEKQKRGEGLLAGERDWDKIPGFHMGGSPLDSNRDKVKGRVVAFSSPSPLRIIKNVKALILGSFVNLGEVYDSCLRAKRDVVVVCAGGPEDSVFAGMLVDFLQSTLGADPVVLSESAKQALAYYKPWQGRIPDLLRETNEGKALIQKGFVKDLDFSGRLSRVSAVPILKDDLFVREEAPKRRAWEDGRKPVVPQKGKSIKITAPLFPKNPEHPVPVVVKAGKKPVAPVVEEKKPLDKKGEKKGAVGAKKSEVKGTLLKPKKAPKPMFSKKTVANAPVKMIKKDS